MRDPSPLVACLGDRTNPVEQGPKTVLTAPVVLPAQQQTRQHKRPLLVRHIRQIRPSRSVAHPSVLDNKNTPAKNLLRCDGHNSFKSNVRRKLPLFLWR